MDFEKLFSDITQRLEDFGTDREQVTRDMGFVKTRVEELDALIKELQMRRKIGFSTGLAFEEGEDKEATEFVGWFKAAITNDSEKLKQMRSDSDADGGYLVPEEFRPRLLRIINQYGLARQLATIIPLTRDKVVFPTLTGGVTIYWGSGMGGQEWTGTGSSGIPESTPQFGEVTLSIDDMYCLVPIANQLLEDSTIDIANLVITLMAEAVAEEEDRIAFLGDVTGASDPFDGIAHSGISMITTAGSDYTAVTADNLLDLTDAIDGSDDNAAYVMHRSILSVIRKLKDNTGNYLIQPQITPGEPPTIWGYPYHTSKVMPKVADSAHDKPYVLFGNMKQLYIGDRKKMAVASSPHRQFEKNRTLIRMVERIAFDVPIPAAFAGIQTYGASTSTTTT